MKKYWFIIFLFASFTCFAQQGKSIYLYGEFGAGGGTGGSIKLDFNSLFLKNNIVSIGLYGYEEKARNMPSDYQGVTFFGIPDPVRSTMALLTLMYGKMVFSPINNRLRVH